MSKIAALLWITAVVIAALGLFQVKYEMQRLEEALQGEHQAILKDQEAIHVLKAAWSYLNQPARLSELAARHLNMVPLSVEQIVVFEALPRRQKRLTDQTVLAELPVLATKARPASAGSAP